jgi:hypothetical protein
MTLFWDHTGPLLRYNNGLLEIEDLNPQIATHWRMSRVEMFLIGLKFLWAAVLG